MGRNRGWILNAPRSQLETVVLCMPSIAAASFWRIFKSRRRFRMWWPNSRSSRGYGDCGGLGTTKVRRNLKGENSIFSIEKLKKIIP